MGQGRGGRGCQLRGEGGRLSDIYPGAMLTIPTSSAGSGQLRSLSLRSGHTCGTKGRYLDTRRGASPVALSTTISCALASAAGSAAPENTRWCNVLKGRSTRSAGSRPVAQAGSGAPSPVTVPHTAAAMASSREKGLEVWSCDTATRAGRRHTRCASTGSGTGGQHSVTGATREATAA
jgi:hypothetical protein